MEKTPLAAASLALAAVAALSLGAGAQVFLDAPGLADSLAAIKAQAAAQRVLGAAHRMGGDRFTAESLSSSGSPAAGPAAAPDVSRYPVLGIDVSHYDGAVDWPQVKGAGLSFVYIKATDGVDVVDEQFARNWDGAARAGLERGAYHFYDFCKGGAAQAALFVKTVPVDARSLPPTIDLEQSKECAKMPAKAAFRKSLAAFVAKVRAAYHRDPVLYVNGSIYAQYFEGENDPYKLWIADVRHAEPQLPAPWTIWQYGWHGHVPGIASEVDLDAFNGTPQMLASLGGGPSDVMVALAP